MPSASKYRLGNAVCNAGCAAVAHHTSDDARRHLTRRHALTVLASWDLRAQFSRRQVAPSNRCRLCMTPFRQVDRIGASIA